MPKRAADALRCMCERVHLILHETFCAHEFAFVLQSRAHVQAEYDGCDQ